MTLKILPPCGLSEHFNHFTISLSHLNALFPLSAYSIGQQSLCSIGGQGLECPDVIDPHKLIKSGITF